MKLLFFASDFQFGLTPYLVDQAIALKSKIKNIYVVSGEKSIEKGLEQRLDENDIKLFRINGLDEHSDFFTLSAQIARIIVDLEIDVVHVQTNWQLCLVSYGKYKKIRPLKIKVVYTIHSFRHNYKIKSVFARWIISLELFLLADKIICSCSYMADKFRILKYKIAHIPLGVNDLFFKSTKSDANINNALKMIFPGYFRIGKNQDLLISAFARYISLSDDSTSVLYLPGDGPLKKDMISLAYEKGISERVIFPGFLSKKELADLFQQCNIGLIPTNSETFGFCIVEPYVMGKCVICRPVGVAVDIIKNKENGFLFDNENDLVEILLSINADKSLLISLPQKAKQFRENFKWSNIAETYYEVLQKMLR